MQKNEQERIFIYRRIINSNSNLKFLVDLSDQKLLEILNSTVLPNSIIKNNLKYSLFFNIIIDPKETLKIVKKFLTLSEILSKIEKDILKFGLFYGFDSYNNSYQFSRYIKMSTDISQGELPFKKKVSSSFFKSIFDFAYKIIYKGEKNGQFPRI